MSVNITQMGKKSHPFPHVKGLSHKKESCYRLTRSLDLYQSKDFLTTVTTGNYISIKTTNI